jgi:hypothetical protein
MIQYYIDGSAKEPMIGAGIVKVNEFGFIEKYHFNIEHINPSSNLAEGYSLEKTMEMIRETDLTKNEIIDIYTDCQRLSNIFLYNQNTEFHKSNFFIKQETDKYFQHLRSLYIELVSKYANLPLFFCEKTKQPRPFIKIFFKDAAQDKKYLELAHSLSRNYIKEEIPPVKVELKAVRKENMWCIVKDNKLVISENKRPIIALSEALKKLNPQTSQIKICNTLETILKSTKNNKSRLSNEALISAMKIIDNHISIINLTP